MAVLLTVAIVVLAVSVGLAVNGLGTSRQAGRYARGGIVLVAVWLLAAYLYLIRIAYRLDLEDSTIVWRSVLRRGRLELQDLQEIRRGFRFTLIEARKRRLQVWTGPGLREFAEAVRSSTADVVIELGDV